MHDAPTLVTIHRAIDALIYTCTSAATSCPSLQLETKDDLEKKTLFVAIWFKLQMVVLQSSLLLMWPWLIHSGANLLFPFFVFFFEVWFLLFMMVCVVGVCCSDVFYDCCGVWRCCGCCSGDFEVAMDVVVIL